MKSSLWQPHRLTLALAAALAAVCGAPGTAAADPQTLASRNQPVGETPVGIVGNRASARYLVRYTAPPLGLYNAQALARGGAPLPLRTNALGTPRLDVQSAPAKTYVAALQAQQQQQIAAIGAALGRPVEPILSLQYALNASLLELTPAEADTVAGLAGVAAVQRDRPHELGTDIGPGFIGAPPLWWNAPAAQDTLFAGGFDNGGGFMGDGVVVGVIDTGYNSLSPSFQPTDSKGYAVANPLGHGHYLGQCNLPLISAAGCNDKVIGVYDEIDLTQSAGAFAAYSVEDTQGHGSHTASTAVGNYRSAAYHSYTHDIAGVAPHANLVVYYACSPDKRVQCSTAATTSAVEHAIADGVVDALNFSISGGADPWDDSTSLAFLSAENAGIFVAAAAGNTSARVPTPVPGSVNHVEPWVATVAAGTHTGGGIGPQLSITGPGTPPAGAQNVDLGPGSSGVAAQADYAGPIVLSPQFRNYDTNGNDGCAGYPSGAFAGAVALVSRGGCTFTSKVNAAAAAGAAAVVIADNRFEFMLSPSVPNTTIPAYGALQSQAAALSVFLQNAPLNAAGLHTADAVIPVQYLRQPQQPDELAPFSLLGPARIDVLKPELQAPGVDILAAVANDGTDAGPDRVDVYNGTSMATPHTAGAAALLRQQHPTWSPAALKSALMLTAKETGLTGPDGQTPSTALDRGSGRIQVTTAGGTGLVLDEDGFHFALANPDAGGDPSTLNLASLQNLACVNGCTFMRTVTSSAAQRVTWTATVSTPANVQVTPSTFTLDPRGKKTLTITLLSGGTPGAETPSFEEVVLQPDIGTLAALHLPIAVQTPGPYLVATPRALDLGSAAGGTGATLHLTNAGGGQFDVDLATSGSATYQWALQETRYVWGQASTQYAARTPNAHEWFAAEDFTVTGTAPARIHYIFTPGFAQPQLSTFGPDLPLHWRIYADDGGKPGGNPEDTVAPVWSYDTTAADGSVSIGWPFYDDLLLDLRSGAVPAIVLPPGRYWLVVYPTLPCMSVGEDCTTGTWYWANSAQGAGAAPQTVEWPATQRVGWTPLDPSTGKGLALELGSEEACSLPPWLTQAGLPASIAARGTVDVGLGASGTVTAPSTAFVCVSDTSNARTITLTPVQVSIRP